MHPTQHLSRRRLLAAFPVAAIAPAMLLHSGPVRAEMTLLAAAAAVATIVGTVAGIISSGDQRKKLDEISSKLDTVIRLEVEIIAEIRALKLYIDESFLRSWEDKYKREIFAEKARYNILASAKKPDVGQFKDLAQAALQSSLELGQLDYSGFPFFAVAASVVLASYHTINYDRESWASTRVEFVRVLDRWLDPANPRSISASILAGEQLAAAARQALNAQPRSVELSRRREEDFQGDGDIVCSELVVQTLAINGNLEAGFTSGGVAVARSGRRCTRPHRPCSPRNCVNLTDETLASARELSLLLRSGKAVGVLGAANVAPQDPPVPVIPSFTASGYEVIDNMNRSRIEMFKLEFEVACKKIFRNRMVEARDALLKPLA